MTHEILRYSQKDRQAAFLYLCSPPEAINEVNGGERSLSSGSGGARGGGAPNPLPCFGLLFLLVTKRSPRTGSPRGAEGSGGTLGRKGGALWHTHSRARASLQSREEGDHGRCLSGHLPLYGCFSTGGVKDLLSLVVFVWAAPEPCLCVFLYYVYECVF